jgi:hypothetical protein
MPTMPDEPSNSSIPNSESDYKTPAELARMGTLAKSWRYARSSHKHAIVFAISLIFIVFIILILIFGFTALFLQSGGSNTADDQLVLRLIAFTKAGAYFVLAVIMFSVVVLIFKVFSVLNIGYKLLFGMMQMAMMLLVIVFTVFGFRASGAIFSSPVMYTGSCKLSTFEGSSTRAGSRHLDYFLKIPNRYVSFIVSYGTYNSLGGDTSSATLNGHNQDKEYNCNRNITIKYVDGTDTIIDLQPLATK